MAKRNALCSVHNKTWPWLLERDRKTKGMRFQKSLTCTPTKAITPPQAFGTKGLMLRQPTPPLWVNAIKTLQLGKESWQSMDCFWNKIKICGFANKQVNPFIQKPFWPEMQHLCGWQKWFQRKSFRPLHEPKVWKVPPECFSSNGFKVASLSLPNSIATNLKAQINESESFSGKADKLRETPTSSASRPVPEASTVMSHVLTCFYFFKPLIHGSCALCYPPGWVWALHPSAPTAASAMQPNPELSKEVAVWSSAHLRWSATGRWSFRRLGSSRHLWNLRFSALRKLVRLPRFRQGLG